MTRTDKRDAVLLIIEAFVSFAVMQIAMFSNMGMLTAFVYGYFLIFAVRILFFAASGTLAVLGFAAKVKNPRAYRLALAILLPLPAIVDLTAILIIVIVIL